MNVPNYYLAQRLSEQRIEDNLRRAEKRRLLREAGVDSRSGTAVRLSKLASAVSSTLAKIGHRESSKVSPPVSSSAGLASAGEA